MPNYNTTLQSNNIDLQAILDSINELPEVGGGEQATPVISVSSNGLITAIAGTKSSTHQLAFQAAKTITPSTASQIAISSGYYTGGDITVNGDSNLVSENIRNGVSIFGVNGTLVEGSGSGEGGYDEIDGLIAGGLSTYTNNRISSIRFGAFYGCETLVSVNFPNCVNIDGKRFTGADGYAGAFTRCSKLTTISFPKVETIGSCAFYGCYSLTTANFSVATSIYEYAFGSCSKLTTASFPVATSIDSNAFRNCSNLTTISFPVVTTIGGGAFYGCNMLTTVNFPAVTTIGSSAFEYCRNLTTVNFPVATTIGSSTFESCSKLTTVNFPNVTTIGSNAFGSCYSLTTASFPAATYISDSAFYKCYNLKSLYLTGSSVCGLYTSYVFSSTPIGGYSVSAGTYGSIYVPASLLTSYQSAAWWKYLSSRFVAYDDGANLITFTINGTPYQAEEGMTWAEWVDSEYNVNDEFSVVGNQVEHTEGTVAYDAGAVSISAVIVADRAYYFYIDDGAI